MDLLSGLLTYFFGALILAVILMIGVWLAKWFAPDHLFEFGFGFLLIVVILLYYFDI